VVIDNRAHAYSTRAHDPRFEWSVAAAASIAIHLLGDGFDLVLAEADGSVLSPHRLGPGREGMVLEHLADLRTDTTPTLRNALAACTRGAEGQLLVAILGRVDAADAAALAEASRRGRACWALLVSDSPQVDGRQAEWVREAGWRCVIAGPGTSVAAAWRELGTEDER
jgi:uncharacterized protein (DUF58 family)